MKRFYCPTISVLLSLFLFFSSSILFGRCISPTNWVNRWAGFARHRQFQKSARVSGFWFVNECVHISCNPWWCVLYRNEPYTNSYPHFVLSAKLFNEIHTHMIIWTFTSGFIWPAYSSLLRIICLNVDVLVCACLFFGQAFQPNEQRNRLNSVKTTDFLLSFHRHINRNRHIENTWKSVRLSFCSIIFFSVHLSWIVIWHRYYDDSQYCVGMNLRQTEYCHQSTNIKFMGMVEQKRQMY